MYRTVVLNSGLFCIINKQTNAPMAKPIDYNDVAKRMQEMPPEDKALIDKIMTRFIQTNYKIHRYQIAKRLKYRVDEDVISEIQQKYYVWLYIRLKPELIKNLAEPEKRIQKLFNFLITHPSIYKMNEFMHRGLVDDFDEEGNSIFNLLADEQEDTFTNGHLNAKEDFEMRKELFYIARDETLDWLMENPESNTAIAIENTIKRLVKQDNKKGPHFHQDKVKSELIDYITAPNINFIRKVLNRQANQELITAFREEFAKLYDINDGKPVKQSQLSTTGWY